MNLWDCLSWSDRLIVGGIAAGMALAVWWLYQDLRDSERQTWGLVKERAGLRTQISELEGRLAQHARDYAAAVAALHKAMAQIERLNAALKSMQTRGLDPPKPLKGIPPGRRSQPSSR